MINLNKYIIEKLKIGKVTYTCQPKDKNELQKILEERLAKDKDADLNDIDVSKITNMHGLFYDLDPHNIDISRWDVSNVEDMCAMFIECKNLNCDLADWDVSKVKDMKQMFYDCNKFEGKGLENWDVSNVTNMYSMFNDCENFNCYLGDWDVSNVQNMWGMFYNCTKFTGKDLEKWKHVTDKRYQANMFYNCTSMKNIPSWYKY